MVLVAANIRKASDVFAFRLAQGLQCSSILGLLGFFGRGLEYSTKKGTTQGGLGFGVSF